MPSRLSSLLVRDGLIGVKRMEQAFQRQVIYGGCLDTILLEMNLVPEERLVQYLSLATGLPPATRGETDVFDPAIVSQCSAEVARSFRVVPLCFEEGALRVLVHDPVDLAMLEDLANELEFPVQPLVVPEYRFHVVFARTYGGLPNPRFVALARRAEESTPTSPVGRARSVIIEEAAPAPIEGDVTARNEAASGEPQDAGEGDDIAAATTQPLPVEGAEAAPTRRGPRDTMVGVGVPADNRKKVVTAPLGSRNASDRSDGVRVGTPAPPAEPDPARAAARSAAVPLEATPLSPLEARAQLATAGDRDHIFGVLLRAVRHRTRYAGLLTIQGGAAVGRMAISDDGLDPAIAEVMIPLDMPSALQNVVRLASPHIGPIATGNPTIDAMVYRMGGVMPPSALLLPVVLRGRIVAMIVGHNIDELVDVGAVAELFPLTAVAAESLSRLIVKAKSGALQAQAEAVPVALPVTPEAAAAATAAAAVAAMAARPARAAEPEPLPPAPTPLAVSEPELPIEPEGGEPEGGARGGAEPDHEPEVSLVADEPEPMDTLLDRIEGDQPGIREPARHEAMRRTGELVPALAARFPGRLRIDRYQLGGRSVPAAQHGPLLAFTVELGDAAAELLAARMIDTRRELRFYATLCASESRPRGLASALAERLFDTDYGTRSAALLGLAGYPAGPELEQALERVRQALFGERAEDVQAAAHALSHLDDIGAIPDLIDAVEREDRASEHARRALVELTGQDFGTSARKWRAWWTKHRRQHRIEWLIDGLAHREESVRRSAVEHLRRLTGEFFDFHHDGARRERELARQRWLDWWSGLGSRRFQRGDERHRSTAVVPDKDD